MSDESTTASKRALEPSERIAEVLFGLIMVLTFTGSLSVADAGRADVRTMLIGALGCNIAWGIIDGILYLMDCLSEQARDIRAWWAVRKASAPDAAHRVDCRGATASCRRRAGSCGIREGASEAGAAARAAEAPAARQV